MLSKLVLVALLASAANAVLNAPCDPAIPTDCTDVANSVCDPTSRVCVCDDRNLATSTGGCDGVLGRSCSIDFGATCNQVPYALCQGPTCECTKEYTNSDSKTACLAPTYGVHCLESDQCTALGEAECVSQRCVCKAGFVSNGNGPCYPVSTNVNGPCDIDAQCSAYDQHALCVITVFGNRCRCRGGWIANSQNSACLDSAHQVGDACSVEEQCTTFDPNSSCTARTCQCNAGYVGSLDGVNCISQVALGGSCQQDQQCSSLAPNSGCVSGVCSCLPGFIPSGSLCVAGRH
ncbi:multiple epidermal growth factor-like domains protein 10 [Neocloeon triangulifer]|uniref:multiple epidermal growth factor-like domains protein 10 n=1 Tax=Neocloeon triangulifer TaxID=2078957 RepID=UPI00286F9DD1|nr:multiple epidermal growth factor-like domains protein 10 [Neocloeon triangulifer]